MSDITKIYAGSQAATAYEKAPSVKGIISGGAKVDLVAGKDYNVVAGKNLTLDSSGKKLKSSVAVASFGAGISEMDASFSIVIINDGTTIEKTTKLSNIAPEISELKMTDSSKKSITLDVSALATPADTKVALLKALKGSDSYGFDVEYDTNSKEMKFKESASATPKIIITASDIHTTDGRVVNNGSDGIDLSSTGWKNGDSFTATFTSGTAKFSIPVDISEYSNPIVHAFR